MKITEYPSIDTLSADNVMLVDGNDGTKKVFVGDALLAALHLTSAELHRIIFRGKNLGGSLTAAQQAAIQNGTFEDMWLGDYWIINDVTWRIVDFDYWLHCGDTAFEKHHLVIMPDSCLYTAIMNDSDDTTGGYVGSKMYTSNLENAKIIIKKAFGSAVLHHREYLVNAVTNGRPSAGAWFDSAVELPTESMMYGHLHFSPTSDGSSIPTLYTIDKVQLALFMVAPKFIMSRNENQWLRDVVSKIYFAVVDGGSGAGYGSVTSAFGVRPVFAIG